ncbi:uncharacterized protein RJT20DRAFT_137079 [Scheffersomyces xylosifermentans]|uniref:uncharacterized protein n=1 Tax=Scheffersomyces xylosifermentans TaxID=1304137 RepID=UPI00315DA458
MEANRNNHDPDEGGNPPAAIPDNQEVLDPLQEERLRLYDLADHISYRAFSRNSFTGKYPIHAAGQHQERPVAYLPENEKDTERLFTDLLNALDKRKDEINFGIMNSRTRANVSHYRYDMDIIDEFNDEYKLCDRLLKAALQSQTLGAKNIAQGGLASFYDRVTDHSFTPMDYTAELHYQEDIRFYNDLIMKLENIVTQLNDDLAHIHE